MPAVRKLLIVALCLLVTSVADTQHPNKEKIDSLKKILPSTKGITRIDCLNALAEEYWWPTYVFPDSILLLSGEAHNEALKINYPSGIAESTMLLGIREIYKKDFIASEKYLRQALGIFETIHSDRGLGWCNLWLGQALYSENNFYDATFYLLKSISFLTKIGDHEGEGKAWAWLAFVYSARGDYDSSFYYSGKSLQVREKMKDNVCIAASFANIGHLYKIVGDYEDALDYYRQGMQYSNTHSINYYGPNWNYFDESIGSVFQLMRNPDSSLFYLQKAIQANPGNQMTRISIGETFLLTHQYDSALAIFLNPIENLKKGNDQQDLMRVLIDAAKAYEGKKNEVAALQYAREGLSIAQKANVKPYMIDGYQLLAEINNHLQKNDSVYFFMKQFILLKDSVANEQFLWRLTNYKKQADFKNKVNQLILLSEDNNVKEEKLKNASLLKWILIIGLFIIAMASIIIYRGLNLKRKNEKLKSAHEQAILKQNAAELEMQALRAQMNPHFIFNCLSSINRFILKNETEAASDYLTKFSRLIRMVLNNSNKTFITLEDELDTLKLYMDMERLRFKNSFDYNISFTNSIDADNVFVPPLLLQPFVENAIWHGLMHREGQGRVEIELSIENKILMCIITDNGIGRKKSAMLKSKSAEKQKSLGLHITHERLALLNKNMDEQTSFNFEDITDDEGNGAGTRVILKIHYRDLMEASS
ncbi:MAG: histidine kinase [Ginsengibacter sp.]